MSCCTQRTLGIYFGAACAGVAILVAFLVKESSRESASVPAPPIDALNSKSNPISSVYPTTPVAHEIEALGPSHEWAGKYVRGDESGDVMCVAPTAGYIRWRYRDYGPPFELYEQRGAIEAHDGRIGLLGIAPPHDTSSWIVVQWGSRRYLLAASDRENFCAAVRDGREPRTTPIGGFFLRDGDEHRDAGPPTAIVPADLCR